MRFHRLLLLAAACSAGACLSFGDLTGGGDDGSNSPDASSDAGADTTTDASATDASSGADASTTPFCANEPDATFCADFDELADAAAGFSSIYISDGGVLALDMTMSKSSPSSLQSGNLPLATGASAHSALVRQTGVAPTTLLELELDMQVDSLATQGTQVEALALVNKSPTRSSLQLNLTTGASNVGEEIVGLDGGVSYTPHFFSKVVPTGKWVHMVITMAFTSLNRSTTVTVDGATVVDHAPMNAAFVAGQVDLYLGNSYSPGPSDGSSIHYDNVRLSVE